MSDRRGVSSVLGVVMILGMTVIMVTSLMVIGTFALQASQVDSELSKIENSMSQLSSKASLVALGDSGTYRFSLGNVGMDSVRIEPDAGEMRIYLNRTGTETEIYNTTALGALTFENGDHRVAYQAGGVWRRSGDDGGRMISPPEFHYRSETLTLPVIRVVGEGSASGAIDGHFQWQETTTKFPNASERDDLVNPVDDADVFVEIKSEYHRGWYDYLTSRSEGDIIHEPENRTVRMELTIPFENQFGRAVSVQQSHDIHDQADVDESDISEGVNYPSVSGKIDDLINDCETNGCDSFDDDVAPFENDTYYANESVTIDDPTFETENGDINVIIDGDLALDGETSILGGGNVSIFTTGTVDFRNNDATDWEHASQFRVYVHSDVSTWDFQKGQNQEITGILYAPNTDIVFNGNVDVKGAVIADNLDVGSASSTISFDESLSGAGLGFDSGQNVIRFLHVTENRIVVEFD